MAYKQKSARNASRGPQAIGDVLSELMARRGYGRVQSAASCEAAWREAAGPLVAKYTRPGQLRRGTLEVVVAHSALMQELGFQKAKLLESLRRLLPDEGIENLRFRVGSVD
ncbi:MAG: DUF721 domain-containing protein [Planctomycetaceae bacterium]|nr:DUF721 domain-containing protein [Planctomycetaceae bacterium]